MSIYDPDIREVLYSNFLKREDFITDKTTKVIDEMEVCRGLSRVDIAVINGKLHGFEIKSERDTLERLQYQMESYNKVFDTMSIVTCKNHLDKVINIVPKWWGIYYVYQNKNELILRRKRKEKINKNIDLRVALELLWKDELIQLLKENGKEKGTKSKTRSALCDVVVSSVDNQVIRNYIRKCLKSRKSWRAVPLQQLCDDLYM